METQEKKETPLVDFRTGWKDPEGKVAKDAPPPEIPGQEVQTMVSRDVDEQFYARMQQTAYVMNQSFVAAMQIVERNLPLGLTMVNPAVAENIKFQSAAMVAGKIFESLEDMVPKITFEPVVAAVVEKK